MKTPVCYICCDSDKSIRVTKRTRLIRLYGQSPGRIFQHLCFIFLSAEINAKGVIHKAFEQYRLKTCIDFQPWAGEANYISIFKGSG